MFPCQPKLLQKLRRTCERAKHGHPELAHLDPAAPLAVQVLREAAQKQQRIDEQNRVDTWILNMEAELAKVRRWVKEADVGEEVLNHLLLSAADKVEKFREVLSKIWEPQKEIP